MSVLKEAREIVANGWHKGDFSDDNGNYCMSGAVCKAIENARHEGTWTEDMDCGWTLLHDVVAEMFHDRSSVCFTPGGRKVYSKSNPVYFNDHPDTNHEDVLAVFDKAILREDERV